MPKIQAVKNIVIFPTWPSLKNVTHHHQMKKKKNNTKRSMIEKIN